MATESPDLADVGAVDVSAFLCELVALGILATSGWRLGAGALTSIGLAIALPLAMAVAWARWMAPRSSRRLTQPARLAAQCAVFAGSAVLASAASLLWLGVVVAVVSCATFAAIARREVRSP